MESNENALANLVKECETYKSDWFRSGWDAFETALKNAKAVLEKQGATLEEKIRQQQHCRQQKMNW